MGIIFSGGRDWIPSPRYQDRPLVNLVRGDVDFLPEFFACLHGVVAIGPFLRGFGVCNGADFESADVPEAHQRQLLIAEALGRRRQRWRTRDRDRVVCRLCEVGVAMLRGV